MGNRNAAAFRPDGIEGGVWKAPLGTAIPTSTADTLDEAFVPLGLIPEDGIEPSRDVSTDKSKDWAGDVILQLKTDDSRSFKFTLVEIYSEAVQKFVYGEDNVTVTAATASTGTEMVVKDVSYDIDDCVLLFKMKYKGKKRWACLPVANSVVSGEGKYAGTELSSYEITTEATKDDNGVRVYDILTNDDVTA